MSDQAQFTNRLIDETSPYLRQHANNPVDWYPWGSEALERSRRENRPIFLSIGYSACHWCHVMAHESFESPEVAQLMNEHFINVKVDREERPDLDHIYMNAVQQMTGRGGWPMSVFLTPELEPLYGGTYFPPSDRHGMPGFPRVLLGVADAWKNRESEARQTAQQLAAAVREQCGGAATGANVTLGVELVDRAAQVLYRAFDSDHGGFGQAPKFPHTMDIRVALRHWKRTGNGASLEIVRTTLDHMAQGGIYDQLGGGFHRYSTDAHWLVPHFEKMLYDNALLAQAYLEAYQAFDVAAYARVARETLDYVLREMTSPDGGFYSTQDADSEGVEGKFFVWSLDELRGILGPAADHFAYVYDVSESGNWEEHNILHLPKTIDQSARMLRISSEELMRSIAESRAKLFAARSKRVAPGRDDKVLVSWNGLMIDAFGLGFQVLGDERYLDAASRAARFILQSMRPANAPTGLLHCFKDGQARFNAYLDDYANFINGLVTLYECDFDLAWLRAALALTEHLVAQFQDADGGGFFYTSTDHERLIARLKETHDGSTPSGTAMAATALIRLGLLTGQTELLLHAERTLQSAAAVLRDAPTAAGQLLIATEWLCATPIQIVVAAGESRDETATAMQIIRRRFIPNKVVALASASSSQDAESLVPLLRDRRSAGATATTFVCRKFACESPLVGIEALSAWVEGAATRE